MSDVGEDGAGRPDPPAEDAGLDEAAKEVTADLDVLSQVMAERDEYRDALQRLQADFENYRKRVMKQQADHLERAAEDLAVKLLDVLDTFDLALAHGEGLDQVHAKLVQVLQKEGLERIDPHGAPFDPTEHDAVVHEAAEEGGEGPDAPATDGHDGTGARSAAPSVTGVMRPGYRWKGRVIRPAMVKVTG